MINKKNFEYLVTIIVKTDQKDNHSSLKYDLQKAIDSTDWEGDDIKVHTVVEVFTLLL